MKVCQALAVSERRACSVLGQARKTQRRIPSTTDEEARLIARIIELATRYGRYGYRRITAMLRQQGWLVNHKKVERIWRREGLKVPKNSQREGDYGLMMVPVSGSDQCIKTTFGAMTSS